MSTITIPAREILAGDILDLGGQPVEVVKSEPHPSPSVPVHYLHLQVVDGRDDYGYAAAMHGFNPDTVLVVTRPEPPDPDAAVVEAMAAEMADRLHSWTLEDLPKVVADNLRNTARALLAIAREAGAL